jgi:ParB-like chromosome segregation protein Spo0J
MMINVTSLTHHPLNKNIYQLSTIGDLMDSIKTVGLLQPIVI